MRLLSILLTALMFSTVVAQKKTPQATGIQFLTDYKIQNRTQGDKEPCMFDKLRNAKMQDPQYREDMQRFENLIRKRVEYLKENYKEGRKAPVLTIPVVFHIYHVGEAEGTGHNIPDAQIQSAVTALNRDFRRLATDGGIAQGAGPDIEVEFCLATIDPQGNPTTGINRINASGTGNYQNVGIDEDVNGLELKALSKWPTKDYVNIWVVREINDQGEFGEWNGGTLGYAYPVSNSPTNNPNTNPTFNPGDGIVVVNFSFGNDPNLTQGWDIYNSFNTNRTLTHEMGHHLNLLHTFDANSCVEGDCATEGDYVCDTPPTVLNNNCNSPACSGTQQVTNYMDYTGESCYNMFSDGQKLRMRAVLEGFSRSSLTSSVGCNGTFANADFEADLTEVGVGGTVTFTDLSTGSPNINSWSWDFGDGNTSTQQNPTHSYATGGFKTVTLTVGNGSDNDTEIKTDYIFVSDEATGTIGGNCDTLRNFTDAEAENLTYYVSGGDYVPAINGSNFEGFAEKFQNTGTYVFQEFTIALGIITDDGPASDVNFRVYEDNGGAPGNAVFSGSVPMSGLTENSFNRITLPAPVVVNGDFFVGFEFEATTDTMTVFSTAFRDNDYNSVFLKSDGSWFVFSDPANFSMAITTIPYTAMDFSLDEENANLDFCTNTTLSLLTSNTVNIDSYDWDLADGNPSSSTSDNPQVNYSSGGFKNITLTASGRCGGDTIREISLFGYEYPDLGFTIIDSDCGQDNGSITVTHNGADQISYEWVGQSNQTNKLEDVGPGSYVLNATNGPCSREYTFEVKEKNALLANDTLTNNPRCELNNGMAAIYMLDAGNYNYEWTGAPTVNNDSLENLGPGSYSVKVRLDNNCLVAEEDFVLTNQGEIPSVGIDAPDTVTQGVATNISGQFPSEGDHDWSFSDGQSDQTGTQISATFNQLGDVVVTLVVENEFGCKDSTEKTIHVKQAVGIYENQEFNVSIYPNPSKQLFYVNSSVDLKEVILLDAVGKQIKLNANPSGGELVLDLNAQQAGTYMLLIELENGAKLYRRLTKL